MRLRLQKPTESEIIKLHDFYQGSSEPDAPKKRFGELAADERSSALIMFSADDHFSLFDSENLVGFLGIYPDQDNLIVNIFYVIDPVYRGRGYLSGVLESAKFYCIENFSDYSHIRTLTRKSNEASIKGLQRAAFMRKGECTEEAQPDIAYEEYLLEISPKKVF